jgi:DNA/RNA-binding domain of Phe-tRNA-synthetase-like protein
VEAPLPSSLADSDAGAPSPHGMPDQTVRSAVRQLLRFGGYKPSGRGRPASESLAKAVEEGRWPTIHPLVDECNRLSLASGLPISVLDAQLVTPPLVVRLGEPGEQYLFNPSGQILDLKGLLLLADAAGPTASPVKDAQRSKISPDSQRFLVVVWGTREAPEALATVQRGVLAWCQRHQLVWQTLIDAL